MKSRERVLGGYNRTGYDRIPIKHEGTPEINQMIMDYFGNYSIYIIYGNYGIWQLSGFLLTLKIKKN